MDAFDLKSDHEQTLICEAKSGSNYALGQLLQTNYSAVYKYMLKLTLDTRLAEDLTQDCMIRVIDKFALYDPQKSALSTWMIAIAKNLWLEECRRGRRRPALELDDHSEIREFPTQKDEVNELIEKDEILSAVKKLSDKLRVPVLLCHAGGYRYDEIAGILKIPLGTVKSRIFNGLKILKKELSSDEQ
jgi:RNA polymerase sigma-70 factor, ECF subfamily